MKKSKKILALVMAIVMATGMLSASFVALAGDDDAYVPETSYERAEVILNYLNYELVEGTLLADLLGLLGVDTADIGLEAGNTVELVVSLVPMLNGLFGGRMITPGSLLQFNDGDDENGIEGLNFLTDAQKAELEDMLANGVPEGTDLSAYLSDEAAIAMLDTMLAALSEMIVDIVAVFLEENGADPSLMETLGLETLLSSGLAGKLAYDPVGLIFSLMPLLDALIPAIYTIIPPLVDLISGNEEEPSSWNSIMQGLIASLPDLLVDLLKDIFDLSALKNMLAMYLTDAAVGVDFNADPFVGLVDYLNKLLPDVISLVGQIAGTTISAVNWVNLPYINIKFTDTTDHPQMLIDLFDGMCGLINTLLDNLVPALLPLLGGLIEGVDLSGLGVAEVAEVLGLMLGIDIPMNGGKFAITGETVVDLIYVLLFPADSDDEDDDEKKTTTSKDSGSTDGDGTEDIAQTGDIFVSVMSIFALASGAALVLTKKKES